MRVNAITKPVPSIDTVLPARNRRVAGEIRIMGMASWPIPAGPSEYGWSQRFLRLAAFPCMPETRAFIRARDRYRCMSTDLLACRPRQAHTTCSIADDEQDQRPVTVSAPAGS